MRKSVTVYIFFTFFVGGISAVSADNKAEAKTYFDQGILLQKQNDNIGATEAFEKSIQAYPNKNNLYNLANCYRVVNRPLDALSTFERIKREFSDKLSAEMAADVDTQIKEITDSVVKLVITTVPEGATIAVDEKAVGETPMKEPMVLAAGEHSVTVSKDGYETSLWKSTFSPGTREEKTFTLNRPNVSGPPQPEPTVETAPLVPLEAAAPMTAATSDKSFHKKMTLLFIGGISGTAVMAGVSAGLWAAAVHQQKEYNQKNDELKSSDESEWTRLEEQRDDAKKASEAYNTAAVVTTVVTGALAALTVTAVVLRATKKQETPKKDTEVSIVPGGLEVRF
jgi:tetratricopeptide (TPR) repeat protein